MSKEEPVKESNVGKLWLEKPDGEKTLIGYAYGSDKDTPDLWVWDGRVWVTRGYLAKLEAVE